MNDGYAQSRSFFDARYRADPDPWNFAGSAYEQARYHATLGALRRAEYERIFEPGCSIGVLTRALCDRGRSVYACDISDVAVARARERCADRANARIEQRDLAQSRPPGTFDLIVFSEIGYYFSAPQLGDLARRLRARLDPGGEFVAVNWLGDSPDHLLHGDEVAEVLDASLACEALGGSRHEGFRIDSWRRRL